MSDSLALVLSRAVRAERARTGLSQQELASRLHTSQTTVAAIEAGTRRLRADELPDLCRALGVTLDVLLIGASKDDRQALGL